MAFIAAIEIDKRQQIIVAADKMKEMLGGSWTIAETRKLAETLVPQGAGVTLIKVASGDIWMRAEELVDLETCLWQFRQKIVYELGLPCSFAIVEERSRSPIPALNYPSLFARLKMRRAERLGICLFHGLRRAKYNPLCMLTIGSRIGKSTNSTNAGAHQ